MYALRIFNYSAMHYDIMSQELAVGSFQLRVHILPQEFCFAHRKRWHKSVEKVFNWNFSHFIVITLTIRVSNRNIKGWTWRIHDSEERKWSSLIKFSRYERIKRDLSLSLPVYPRWAIKIIIGECIIFLLTINNGITGLNKRLFT